MLLFIDPIKEIHYQIQELRVNEEGLSVSLNLVKMRNSIVSALIRLPA